ncbi:hypothetical protein HZS_8010 [Henneguya salminicola]|nr:hypothetical protein HZS_8010 [Henneguya salminicola]
MLDRHNITEMLKISHDEKYENNVIATRDISKGEKVVELSHLPLLAKNNRHAITKEIGKYFDTTNHLGKYFNHCCEPNLTLNFRDWAFYALRNIKQFEIVTFNYSQTEYELSNPFFCLCESKFCLGEIKGWKWLDEDKRNWID